jgi:hypothetical protein
MQMKLVWLALLVAALGVVGGASAVGSTPGARTAGDAVVSGTFAGKADGAVAGVAVVAEKPAAERQARKISVYVCNGTSLAVWLTGTTTGNVADLRSADGRFGVHVELAAQTASGKFGIVGGGGFRFTVPRALGIAGLFDVTVAANRLLRGTSPTGGSLTGQVGTAGKLSSRGTVTATATAGGQDVKLTAPARHLTPGAYRWIVLPSRTVYGANKRGPGFGGIGGLVLRPTGDKQVRIKAGSAGQKGYDDKKCGQLAGQFNKLNKQFEAGITSGKQTAASEAAGTKAQKIFDELENHCMVIF